VVTPEILWKGSPNFYSRDGMLPRAIVIHTMDGSLPGTDAWFNNPASEVSAHFGVSQLGEIHQYVALENAAWANGVLEPGNHWPYSGNPNFRTISIETEDKGNYLSPVSTLEFSAVLALVLWITDQFSSLEYLATHTSISPRARPNCPGPRWLDSGLFEKLAKASGLKILV
jgi:N-acetylmuramoyl-L-alanine amidase